MGFDDIISKPDLGLGLGLQGEQYCNQKQKQMKKKEGDPRNKGYPSLTLGPPDDDELAITSTTQTTATDHHKSDEGFHPQAAASSPSVAISNSFSNLSSIKRERREEDQELLLLLDPDHDQVEVEEKVVPSSSSRKKLRLTKQQSALLEDSFKHHSTLNLKEKQELARKLNLRARQVEVWFQNRRARTKLKQTEVEFEVLKKFCETLREENSKLQKELQDLKSTVTKKEPTSSSLYVQQHQLPLPVASLTICPSCGGNSSSNNNGLLPYSPTKTPLLIGSSKFVHPHHHYLLYNQTNYPFTQSSAAC